MPSCGVRVFYEQGPASRPVALRPRGAIVEYQRARRMPRLILLRRQPDDVPRRREIRQGLLIGPAIKLCLPGRLGP